MYYDSRDYPRSAHEWWALASTYASDIVALLFRVKVRSTKHAALVKLFNTTEKYKKAVECRNADLAKALSYIWMALPNSKSTQALSGFSVLCDLCSEAYVLTLKHRRPVAVNFTDITEDELNGV